jgi:intracellular septation protein
MKFLLDFLPIFIFFILFKFQGIYVATGGFLIASLLQILISFIRYKKVEFIQIMTFLLGSILGGATLLLHNELFIKWKPTLVYWCLAIFFLFSQWYSKANVMERMLNSQIKLHPSMWKRLNYLWVMFFTTMGLLNLIVIYHFNTDIWVDFKLFGLLGLTLLFIILQSCYLNRHLKNPTDEN